MQTLIDLLAPLFVDLEQELWGLLGGVLFLGSWVLQAWESKRNGSPVVSMRFFMFRLFGCFFLAYEGYRTGSLSLVIVMIATSAMMLFNIFLLLKKR